jgi:hypothetical protein
MKNPRSFLPGLFIWNRRFTALILFVIIFLGVGALALADIPGRVGVRGTVPNPGTQQQELANLTFPSPYNTFEFVVTCAACHGGAIDQNAGHFGNWAGSNMASAARDPVFRANNRIVNEEVKALTGTDGVGNMCFRCHSPNGWYSGRYDPTLAGRADAGNMLKSILLSTDTEGVLCETCHRTIGGVKMKRTDLDPNDPVWQMMAGIDDWPHAGDPFPAGPVKNFPYGDTTLQINDGMTYGGKYRGSVGIYFKDIPLTGTYTGQTYGVLPDGTPVTNPDGSYPLHYEQPLAPSSDPTLQALSLEHPTFKGNYITTPEFCGTCHDLTIPVLNHGMPEQRTYSEWKYSDFGLKTAPTYKRCQDCHMPTLKHEFTDDLPVSLNPDPAVTGWFPYARDRNPNGGTTFHKFAGANRNLPKMMKLLYPEVDLEVIGQVTGNDTRVFPGMLSGRNPMWDRTIRNTENLLQEAVNVQILSGPTQLPPGTPIGSPGRWQVKVRVTNNAGHRFPSGYPDGRRAWLSLVVLNAAGDPVYRSGYYDPVTAELYTTTKKVYGLTRALTPNIDSANNAVMIYEKRTGSRNPDGSYTMSLSLLNNTVLFDNRLPPAGFRYSGYQAAGTKFWKYTLPTFAPVEDPTRFPEGQNWDDVTYTFSVPARLGTPASVRAELYMQSNSREHMEYLKDNCPTTPRPEGGPSIFELNYPLTPNYLSDVIGLAGMTDLAGNPLPDSWGGIAYAAWLKSGKGEPFMAGADSTVYNAAPAAPTDFKVTRVMDPATGLLDPFTLYMSWDLMPNAEFYELWVRYGKDATGATTSWDKLATIRKTRGVKAGFRHEALNVAKTYQYKLVAVNGKGKGPDSAVRTKSTVTDLPLPPENLTLVGATANSATISWYDAADNEQGFIIERQDVPAVANFVEIARIPTPNGPGFGGVNWTDNTVVSGRTYNYRVAAYNASGKSTYTVPALAVLIP